MVTHLVKTALHGYKEVTQTIVEYAGQLLQNFKISNILSSSGQVMVDPQITNCGHTFCKDCIAGIQRSNTNHCGICRAAVTISVTNLSLKKVIAELCKGCCIQCGNGMTLSDMGNHECPEVKTAYFFITALCSIKYDRQNRLFCSFSRPLVFEI